MNSTDTPIIENTINPYSIGVNKLLANRYPISLSLSATATILTSSLAIATLYNMVFWRQMFIRLDPLSLDGAFFSLLMLLVISLPSLVLLLLFGSKYTLKPILYFLIVMASLISWFSQLGIVIDEDMIRNVFQTNFHEASELVNLHFLLHNLAFAVLPLFIIYNLKINYQGLAGEFVIRTAITGLVILLIFILMLANFKFASYFGRENRDLRMYLNPGFAIFSLERYLSHTFGSVETFHVIGSDAHQVLVGSKKTVGIIVVGETARADHFSLNGYTRNTNPELAKKDVLNFNQVSSCGTSTAYSVPCMFSFLEADNYSPNKANAQSNLLDVLEKAGVKTLWLDNNSTCKGVCKRIESVNYREDINPDSKFYHEGEYVDEVLLSDLEKKISSVNSDILIVFHQLGSHGPAYHRRYPDNFARFKPACSSNSPQDCSNEMVNNSYDNTILYTDYFLSKTIDLLQKNDTNYQSFMIYVSDHGESLGEDGVYLHGLPKSIAPDAQTHVPMIVWLSDEKKLDISLKTTNLKKCLKKPVSHDNLTHSVLSLFHVDSKIKRNDLDLFSHGCIAS